MSKVLHLLESIQVLNYFEELTEDVDFIENEYEQLIIKEAIDQILNMEDLTIYEKIEAIEELKDETKASMKKWGKRAAVAGVVGAAGVTAHKLGATDFIKRQYGNFTASKAKAIATSKAAGVAGTPVTAVKTANAGYGSSAVGKKVGATKAKAIQNRSLSAAKVSPNPSIVATKTAKAGYGSSAVGKKLSATKAKAIQTRANSAFSKY